MTAHALGAIHSREALPYLAQLLDDTEQSLRVEAVGGLSAFANGLPAQTAANGSSLAYLNLSNESPYRSADTIANFAQGKQAIQQDEQKYLGFWKNWWLQNSAQLTH